MAPIIRIILRYLTIPFLWFGLITEGEASSIVTDPEFFQWASLAIGSVAPFISEGWYWLASKFGWQR